jgi:ABC-type glutathione transport system ATPase component
VAAKVLEIDRLGVEFGFVFQDSATSLNPPLRVGDCVAAPLNVDKVLREAEYTAWVAELLDAVRLPNTGARYPHELSGGQRQLATAPTPMHTRPRGAPVHPAGGMTEEAR